jgi:hypothetical protein
VELADPRGAVASGAKQRGQSFHVIKALEMVGGVLQAVLPVRMIEQAGKYNRPTRAAAGGRGVGVLESRRIGGECIEVRRLDHWVAIAAGILPLVIGDKQHNVAVGGKRV